MRWVLLGVALLAAAALIALWWQSGPAGRSVADRTATVERETERARIPADAAPDATDKDEPAPLEAEVRRRAGLHGRLVYRDGSPAGDIALQLAVGRPFCTKAYRNRDYPDKVVWLVTHHLVERTDADGTFAFPFVRGPAGSKHVLFTEADSPAYVLAEFDPAEQVVTALRRVLLTGCILSEEGVLRPGVWVAAQRERPEDWQTRRSKEEDSFVHAERGLLDVDPEVRVETLTGEDGRFRLCVVPGTNFVSLGEKRERGVHEVVVPDDNVDVGALVLQPAEAVQPSAARSLRGLVLDCAGSPHAGAAVWVWDGSVGDPTDEVVTDKRGHFRFDNLFSPHVIAWAYSPAERRHVVLPEQGSGILFMPCDTPVVLTLPRPAEYCWLTIEADGYALFEREGVLLGSDLLDAELPVGLPPGSYRIVVLTPEGRILESHVGLTEGGDRLLGKGAFRDTTDAGE